MKEMTKMPVRVQNGNNEIETYESEGGFCMTTEFLGKVVGYADPSVSMPRLFRRHKAALEQHRFTITIDRKPQGGRPATFYDARGCVKVLGLAGTPQAKEFLPRLVDHLADLEAKRIERIERYWFGKRPYWPEIRERVMAGHPFRVIAEAMGRSTASVRNAVSRMIEVGILQPLRAAQAALSNTGRKAIIRYSRKFDTERQPLLPGFSTTVTE